MKAEDIYDKALTEYPIKEKLNEKAVGTYDANYPRRKAFEAGAEWMQEQMIDNPDGGALLYAVEKTAERTKREMIEKASKFIHDTIFNWANDYDLDAGLTWNELRAKYIERFKQAMENEN